MKKLSVLSAVLLIAMSVFLESCCCCVPCPLIYEEEFPIEVETNGCRHEWQIATCTSPEICIWCGISRGDTLEHEWLEATCKRPQTCSRCGITEGSIGDHTWLVTSYTEPKYCIVCGETDGNGGEEIDTGNHPTEIGDPDEYSYFECDQVVYVNNPNSAVTLRNADYEAMGSVAHGTELRRIGLSTDEVNYWSMVVYNEQTYYLATKFLTTISDPDEGFVAVDKIVVVKDQIGSLNIRNLPTIDGSQIIGWAVAGTEYRVVAENTETGWYKIEFIPYGATEIAYGYIISDADNFVH